MRHPRRARNISLVVLGVGVIGVLVALWLTGRNRPGTVEVILGVLGLKAVIVAAVLAIVFQVRIVRRYDRLRRGEGILARWRVEPARWKRFREAAVAQSQVRGALPNEWKLPTEVPADGIDVIITQDAFCVGPEFEPLSPTTTVRVDGLVLEIQQRVPQGRYTTRLAVYRMPAPENAEADLARVAECFARQADRSRTLVRNVALVALAIALGLLGWLGIWVANVKRG